MPPAHSFGNRSLRVPMGSGRGPGEMHCRASGCGRRHNEAPDDQWFQWWIKAFIQKPQWRLGLLDPAATTREENWSDIAIPYLNTLSELLSFQPIPVVSLLPVSTGKQRFDSPNASLSPGWVSLFSQVKHFGL